ncbi:MAG: RpiB/LacA/LacB family sugar-phosphate isomerase [Oscillospiraceae bacterium]|nr:RpiB/LacA/LacB family sugar-phosphate isomerase [Oscillospiraceae bacterium]
MKIAVINEVSARDKNPFIVAALEKTGHQVFNVGMCAGDFEVELSYIHTGLMAAIALDSGAADFVVGGCGTGQGFLISAMQYPGVYCGHITNPLDAFLFSQINAGNCISLALNKGFGWAGEINLEYIFEKLFCGELGAGYPLERAEPQRVNREILKGVSVKTHKSMPEILDTIDSGSIAVIKSHKPFMDLVGEYNLP